mmetsp:Transcript_69089/g.225246  ORF Transcript_69089/g.225246 Transcript_69089/m.225246 type:complete len:283 (-) Transcript_69089:15-863(-)
MQVLRHSQMSRLHLLHQRVPMPSSGIIVSHQTSLGVLGWHSENILSDVLHLRGPGGGSGPEVICEEHDRCSLRGGVRAEGDAGEAEVRIEQVGPVASLRCPIVQEHVVNHLLGRPHAEDHVLPALLPVLAGTRQPGLGCRAVGAHVRALAGGPQVRDMLGARLGDGLGHHHRRQGRRTTEVLEAALERGRTLRRLHLHLALRVCQRIAFVAIVQRAHLVRIGCGVPAQHIDLSQDSSGQLRRDIRIVGIVASAEADAATNSRHRRARVWRKRPPARRERPAA